MTKTLLICGNGMIGEVIKDIKLWCYKVAPISEFPHEIGVSEADFFYEANTRSCKSALAAADEWAS